MTDDPRLPTGEAHRPPSFDRRELLTAVATLAAVLGLPTAAVAATGAELQRETAAFADLSVSITGFVPKDPSLVEHFFAAFADETEELIRLHDIVKATPPDGWEPAIAAAGLAPLAEALMTAWYSGAVGEGPETRVVTYLDAFAWYAVGYTKPPTRCADAFGGWADAPHEMR